MYQAAFERLLRVELAPGHEHFQCAASANEPRQPLRPAPARENSERAAWMSEHGIRRRYSFMTGQGQVESSAHAIPSNRRNDRLPRLLDSAKHILPIPREFVRFGRRQSRELRNFRSSSKGALAAGDYAAFQRRLACEAFNFARKVCQDRALEPWISVIAGEREEENFTVCSCEQASAH